MVQQPEPEVPETVTCKLTCADEFIERFPERYNTYIEQGGNNVSGGQKQKQEIIEKIKKQLIDVMSEDVCNKVQTKFQKLELM